MKALVTGSSGFLGSHICDELVERGHEVVGFDLSPSPWANSIAFVHGDIRDVERLSSALGGCHAVFNCAAIADLDEARLQPRRAVEVNVVGTLSVLEAASSAGVTRFMQASSIYVYSHVGSVYRTTKQAAEGLIEDLSASWGIQSTILRFGSLYGPRADLQNAILRLTTQAINEGRIDFWGDGSEVREYIHIHDAAKLAVDALSEDYVAQSLHITGNERITTLELLDTINEILGGSIEINLRNEPFAGRYRLTPYAYREGIGRKMVGATYVDLGVGLLEAIRSIRVSGDEGGGQ
jgi:UDP-glucose 4-epimerase